MDSSSLRTVVLGEDRSSMAVEKVLGATGHQIRRRRAGDVHDLSLREAVRRDLGVTGLCRKRRVNVVSVFGPDSEPSEVSELVRALRSTLLWEGLFVAVMADTIKADTLRNAPLVPGLGSEGAFGAVPGHVVLSHPLCIARLVSVIRSQPSMYLESWLAVNALPELDALRSGRDRLCALLKEGQFELASTIARSTLSALRSVDWWALSPNHSWERSVSIFMRGDALRFTGDEAFCRQLLTLLDQIFAEPERVD